MLINDNSLLSLALDYQQNPRRNLHQFENKQVGLLFFNPSLRTRVSTQIACNHLGAKYWSINAKDDLWHIEFIKDAIMDGPSQEHIIETVRVMSTYCDVLGVRTLPNLKNQVEDDQEEILNTIIQYASIPVFSMESATMHPLQSLADLLTIKSQWYNQHKKPKVVLTWAPHIKPIPQCVANSLSLCLKNRDDVDYSITHPKGYALNPIYTQGLSINHNQNDAIKNADFIYVKNWSSYENYGQMPPVDKDWMLTLDKVKRLAPRSSIMHCLPVRRNVELAGDILDSPFSIATQQAQNRIYSAQAVLHNLLG